VELRHDEVLRKPLLGRSLVCTLNPRAGFYPCPGQLCDQGVPPPTTRYILKLMIVSLTMINVDLFREIVPGTIFLLS
jgi:hypothetical protein